MKNQRSSRLAVAYSVFAAFFPLTFTFANGRTSFMIDSPANLVWCFLLWGLAIYLLIHFRGSISHRKLTALAILYLIVPFSFQFSHTGFSFIILRSSLPVAVSLILMGVLFMVFAAKAKRMQS